MISHSCAALSEPYQPYLPLSEPCPANLTLKLHQPSELTPFSRYHVTFMLYLWAGPGPGLRFHLALALATLLETRCVCFILFPLALRPLLRAWPQWAHQAALVNADVRVSILSCHGHPQAASAAAWLNNSSSLVYSSLPGCEWLSEPQHRPLPGPAALASNPISNSATRNLL